jgi:hypothetical protein
MKTTMTTILSDQLAAMWRVSRPEMEQPRVVISRRTLIESNDAGLNNGGQ